MSTRAASTRDCASCTSRSEAMPKSRLLRISSYAFCWASRVARPAAGSPGPPPASGSWPPRRPPARSGQPSEGLLRGQVLLQRPCSFRLRMRPKKSISHAVAPSSGCTGRRSPTRRRPTGFSARGRRRWRQPRSPWGTAPRWMTTGPGSCRRSARSRVPVAQRPLDDGLELRIGEELRQPRSAAAGAPVAAAASAAGSSRAAGTGQAGCSYSLPLRAAAEQGQSHRENEDSVPWCYSSCGWSSSGAWDAIRRLVFRPRPWTTST